MDVGNLVGQIMPLIVAWILFPLVMLVLYFYVRSMLNRRKREKLAMMQETKAPTVSAGGTSALEMLRQAQDETGSTPVKYDTGELPDLDLLLSPPPAQTPAAAPAAFASTRVIPASAQRVQLHTGRVTAAKELLTVLRDESDNRLMVQIGTTGYRTLLDTPEAKKEFTRLMKELSSSIMTPDDASAAVVPDAAESSPQNPAQYAEPVEEVGSLGALLGEKQPELPPAKKTAPPPPPIDGRMPGDLPSYKFDDNPAKIQMGRTGNVKKIEFTPPPVLDIPSAIEAYLQYKIQYTPEYQGREIHVRAAPDGGVRIQVGQVFYDAVDDVTDTDIRYFLKETIAEWQQRQ